MSDFEAVLILSLFPGLFGLLLYGLLQSRLDRSSWLWIASCATVSLGLILRSLEAYTPAAVHLGLSASMIVLSLVLCGHSLQALLAPTGRGTADLGAVRLRYLACIGAGGLVLLAHGYQGSLGAVAAISLVNGLATAWIAVQALAVVRQRRSREAHVVLAVTVAIGSLWMLRAMAAAFGLLPSHEQLIFVNRLSVSLMVLLSLARSGAYLALRLNEVAEETAQQIAEKAELRRALQEREELMATLTISNKAVGMGALASALAHELNQPLTAMSIEAQAGLRLLARDDEPDLQRLSTHLRRIKGDVDRSADLIRKLRSMFSPHEAEAGSSPLDLSLLAHEVLPLVQPHAHRHNIMLRSHLQPGVWVCADRTQLHQVILNLLTNACNAIASEGSSQTPPDGADTAANSNRRRATVDLDVQLEGRQVRLEVRDDGPGFPPGFSVGADPGYLTPFSHHSPDGSGIGLWLSKRIVEMHHGTMTLENRHGRGARVSVLLDAIHPPAVDISLAGAPPVRQAGQRASFNAARFTVPAVPAVPERHVSNSQWARL